jgi:RND family efflux transporter MFP subunit
VLAVSHSAQFGKRMNLTHAVGSAMDEAIDQKSVIVHPPPAQGEVLVTRDHAKLAHDHGSDSVLTVPFSGAGDDFIGAFTFERPGHLPFDAATVELCQSVIAVLSRLLEAKRLNDRHLAGRVLDALREQTGKLFGSRYMKRKLAVISLAMLAIFFTFATHEYRVTAPSTLEGAVRRTLAAPFDGYISSAERRAGDIVRAGSVLAMLDDRDLRLERLRWASQFSQYSKQYHEAVAGHDRAKAQIAQAQAEQARAQMALAEEQLSRATLLAPFDGIVAKGDLSQSLGSSVRRGDTLFELTPLDAYRVIIQVDEGEITDVRAGQKGTLVLASISDEPFDLTVTSVTPVTTSREGRNYFRVEASLDRISDRLRPGMEGVAKISIEERKLIWIWTHKMMNWLRLFLWTWWP